MGWTPSWNGYQSLVCQKGGHGSSKLSNLVVYKKRYKGLVVVGTGDSDLKKHVGRQGQDPD
jgi:hypothetical protein